MVYYPNIPGSNPAYSILLYCENGRSEAGVFQLFDHPNPAIVGIEQQEFDLMFDVYPNPTNGVVIVRSDMPIKTAWITDLRGRKTQPLVMNGEIWQADLKKQASGLYLVEILIEGGRTGVKKILKQ